MPTVSKAPRDIESCCGLARGVVPVGTRVQLSGPARDFFRVDQTHVERRHRHDEGGRFALETTFR